MGMTKRQRAIALADRQGSAARGMTGTLEAALRAREETIEVRIYKLRTNGEFTYAGRAELPVERRELLDTVGASSRVKPIKVRCVSIGDRLYKLEKEAGRPAIFLPPGDAPPKGML